MTKRNSLMLKWFILLSVSLLFVTGMWRMQDGSTRANTLANVDQAEDMAVTSEEDVDLPVDAEDYDEWILKWKQGYTLPESDSFDVLDVDEQRRIALVKLGEDVSKADWYAEWAAKKEIEYVEPNYTLKISQRVQPGDPEFFNQPFLQQINAPEGWAYERQNTDIIIAVLDTGVDLNHPDLKDNLIQGINMIESSRPPQDDNGHGTQITGVLAAKGNNKRGISGVLWSAKVMPIKVLPKEGEGSPYIVSQGIYESINRGASIILLSLGGPIYSKTLHEAVEYAESQQVLMIAATGNEGQRVNYPAAFPTVLAVGAVTDQDRPASYSNTGPEVSVVAPGHVFTTHLNGRYGNASGTSMSAAQVAGLAALILKQYPHMSPAEVRNQIIYTARDVHQSGWDVATGHGRIDMEQALGTKPVKDVYEPNDTQSQAAPFPVETMVLAQLSGANDTDWYRIEAPYSGTVSIDLRLASSRNNGVDVTFLPGSQGQNYVYNVKQTRRLNLHVPKGMSYIRINYSPHERSTSALMYQMTSTFTIYEDAQQPNNSRKLATQVNGDGTVLTGTFHQDNQYDWYSIDVPQKGELDVHISTDTVRIDPVLLVEKPDGSSIMVDHGDIANGQEERYTEVVEPGRYYFRLHHYYNHKVNGEYYLRVSFRPYFNDPYELNDTLQMATSIPDSNPLEANIHTRYDVDWYRFTVQDERYIEAKLYRLPQNVGLQMVLVDGASRVLDTRTQGNNQNELSLGRKLEPGTYYIRVSAKRDFLFESYHLQVEQQEIIGGYRDIKDHWAMDQILEASELGYFRGVGDYLFGPDDPMTRAAVTQVLQNMYHFDSSQSEQVYSDVHSNYWAFDAIQRVSGAGVMSGYEDGTFRPSKSITRAEIAALVDRLLATEVNGRTVYADVSTDHWAYESISKVSQLGILRGYSDGTFHPEQPITRAEFATLILRLLAIS